jgi:hypothetical protein
MAGIVKWFVDFFRPAVMTLNVRGSIRAAARDMLMRKWHEDRRSDLKHYQSNNRDPLYEVCEHCLNLRIR